MNEQRKEESCDKGAHHFLHCSSRLLPFVPSSVRKLCKCEKTRE